MTVLSPAIPSSESPIHAEAEPASIDVPSDQSGTDERAMLDRIEVGKRLQDDLTWFLTNLKELSDEIGEQFVAVHSRRIVAHADTIAELREQIKQQGIERPLITRSGLASWDLVR